MGGQFWVGGYWWGSPAYVSFILDVMGLDIGRDLELKARAYAATASAACWWWPHNDFVIVSERPTHIDVGGAELARWEWKDDIGNDCHWSVGGSK